MALDALLAPRNAETSPSGAKRLAFSMRHPVCHSPYHSISGISFICLPGVTPLLLPIIVTHAEHYRSRHMGMGSPAKRIGGLVCYCMSSISTHNLEQLPVSLASDRPLRQPVIAWRLARRRWYSDERSSLSFIRQRQQKAVTCLRTQRDTWRQRPLYFRRRMLQWLML